MMAIAMPAPSSIRPAGASRAPELDRATLAGCRAQDPVAFRAFVVRYQRAVFACLSRMLGRGPHIEDLAQDVFVQVFKAVGTFRGDSKFSTWLYRIAVNLTKNRVKYLRVRHTNEQEELDSVAEKSLGDARPAGGGGLGRPDEQLAGKQVERIVQVAIQELEPSFRECLVLRDVEELSYEEIEQITGLPAGTVKSRIHRARAMLREKVERELGEKIR